MFKLILPACTIQITMEKSEENIHVDIGAHRKIPQITAANYLKEV